MAAQCAKCHNNFKSKADLDASKCAVENAEHRLSGAVMAWKGLRDSKRLGDYVSDKELNNAFAKKEKLSHELTRIKAIKKPKKKAWLSGMCQFKQHGVCQKSVQQGSENCPCSCHERDVAA